MFQFYFMIILSKQNTPIQLFEIACVSNQMVATPEWFGVRARLFRFAYIAPPVSFRLYIYRDDDEWPRLNTDSIRGNPCQSLSSLYLDTKGDTYDPQNCIKLWHVKFDQCGTSICTIRRSNPLTQMYKILSQIKG